MTANTEPSGAGELEQLVRKMTNCNNQLCTTCPDYVRQLQDRDRIARLDQIHRDFLAIDVNSDLDESQILDLRLAQEEQLSTPSTLESKET